MAKNAVAQFFAALSTDKALQGALNQALAERAPGAIVRIAKSSGFTFSIEELADVLNGSGELSDADLATAVGGLAGTTEGGFKKFKLVTPFPSFAEVMTDGERRESGAQNEGEKASALDVYEELLG